VPCLKFFDKIVKMIFLIQHNLLNNRQLQDVSDAVAHYPHEFIGVIPKTKEVTANKELIGNSYIPYGSTLFSSIALKKNWSGLHFDLDLFSMSAFIKNRGDMLNTLVVLSKGSAIDYLNRNKAKTFFVRPDLDLKLFSGVTTTGLNAASLLIKTNAEEETKFLISKPQEITAEYRWFIIDRKAVSGACYKLNGKLCATKILDPLQKEIAQQFADKWLPNDCCVMDLCLVGGELKIVEFNCINASGFYGHDIDLIFSEWYKYFLTK
jgi:ATP-grasp domain, R2K clade family 3